MSTVEAERVLVIPTEVFHSLGHFQGFCGQTDRYLETLLDPKHVSYRLRGEMESDPNFKQLIPYVIFRFTNAAGGLEVFQYRRGSGQGEKRLHAKRSVGIGGHISAIDAAEENPYLEGMRRELDEEVIIETPYESSCVGLINDDETDVGRVHLGIVHFFDVERPEIRGREEDITETGFHSVDELRQNLDEFESWSQICLTSLF